MCRCAAHCRHGRDSIISEKYDAEIDPGSRTMGNYHDWLIQVRL